MHYHTRPSVPPRRPKIDPRGTILVTGATGFIGSRLAGLLVERGAAVRALVRNPERLRRIAGLEPVPGDLLDGESLRGIERGVSIVVHCASILGKWGTDERALRDVNVEGTQRLVERFAGTGARFVHLSAGGVSGPVRQRAVDETYPCRPATAYERTKYEAERAVLARCAAGDLPAVVLRPTFTYGPGDPHKVALFRAVQRGRYVFVGDGESVNHPVFIDDLLEGLALGIERGRPGEVYILGGDRPVTKRELVGEIADALGVARPSRSVPRWVADLAAPVLEGLGTTLGFEPILTRSRVMMMADNFGYSIAKARRELGYAPRTSLHEGILATVRHYREAGVL